MSLQQAISEYVARKASFESSQARATEIQSVLLPDAEQGISTARSAKSQAEIALRSAGTVAEVQAARASLSQAEQEFNDRVQLRDNLDSELKSLNSTKERHRTEMHDSRRRMFELKRLEMLDAFTLTAQQLEQLENIIAANTAATRSPRNGYSDPVKEKYGDMDGGKKAQLEQALLDEMVASIP
ncbi:MAG: hypothetical protein COB05_09805 [Marinobacter sp.]|nr:MAG: hypothetical protein COB05_09805 [Marinobacter sp.]